MTPARLPSSANDMGQIEKNYPSFFQKAYIYYQSWNQEAEYSIATTANAV
jgi:hypothetical protein